jgi:hypothetical protein
MASMSMKAATPFTAVVFLLALCVQAVDAQPAGSRASPSEVAAVASSIAAAIATARTRFFAEFGGKAFDRMDFPNGRSRGNMWNEYLAQAGYPRTTAERQRIARLLTDAGLDDSAATTLILGVATEESIEHLLAGLKRLVSGTGKPGIALADPNGATFIVEFDEDLTVQTTISTKEGATYRPRQDDEIAWRYICGSGGLPDVRKLNAPQCDDDNYGYLIANAEKTPLTSDQGQYTFVGTRTTGQEMTFEAPSRYCRPLFLAMKRSKCVLEIRVRRRQK